MTDILVRLRSRIVVDGVKMPGNDDLHREAADAIEALRAELAASCRCHIEAEAANTRLPTEGAIMREALRKIAEEHDADGSMRFEAQAALDSVSGRQQ